MLIHPQIDPIAISLGPLAVRWYDAASASESRGVRRCEAEAVSPDIVAVAVVVEDCAHAGLLLGMSCSGDRSDP